MQRLQSVGHEIIFGTIDVVLSNHFDENPGARAIIIADENTLEHCWPKLIGSNDVFNESEILQIESGEASKNLEVCAQLWISMAEMKVSRGDVIVNLGGGVVTDMGGFVANTFKRGVNFIQVPTSLLGMVDAAVGGKVGVDLAGLKNIVGNFAVPQFVAIDPVFIETLPYSQVRSGFAEILKHGLILDAAYWELSKSTDLSAHEAVGSLVHRSIELKNSVVVTDFNEQGDRKKLNFGHTVGHAIETYFLTTNSPMLHGDAVAVGMIAESMLSNRFGTLSDRDLKEIKEVILTYFELPKLSKDVLPILIELMKNDKKNRGNEINFTFLHSIGNSVVNQVCDESQIIPVLTELLVD